MTINQEPNMSRDHHHDTNMTIHIAGFHEESKQMNRHICICRNYFFFWEDTKTLKLFKGKEWTLENVLGIAEN